MYNISKNTKIEYLLLNNVYTDTTSPYLSIWLNLPTYSFGDSIIQNKISSDKIKSILENLGIIVWNVNYGYFINNIKIYFYPAYLKNPFYISRIELYNSIRYSTSIQDLLLVDGNLEDIIDNVIEYQINKYKQYGT
jgi:hypothetical protein